MSAYPEYDENGEEILSFENIWREISPQTILGADCFTPNVALNPTDNLIVLKLTALEFREIFSALYNGAELTYPDKFMQVVINFLKGLHCPPLMIEQECFEYPTYSSFIAYSPTSPYLEPTTVPEGYLIPPFLVVEADDPDWNDYEQFDVITPFGAFEFLGNWFDILDGFLPQITIMVNGAGKAFIKLLPIFNGGMACVTLDNPPNLIDIFGGIVTGADNILDLNLDTVSAPPETAHEIIYELDVVGSGIHTIYITFLPVVDDASIPLRYGGGFRGVQLCNFVEMPTMGIQDIRFNAETCLLETLTDGEWTSVFGYENWLNCIADAPAISEINNNITIIEGQLSDVTGDVGSLIVSEGASNITPPASSYTGDDLCNASDYAATQIVNGAIDVFNQHNSSNRTSWLEGLIQDASGWISEQLTPLWNSIDGAYAATTTELNAAQEHLQTALYNAGMDIAGAKTALLANGSVSSHAKAALGAFLDAISIGRLGEYAFIGKEANSGGCLPTTAWAWSWEVSGCSYGLPSGWGLAQDSTCGDGVGAFDGIYKVRSGNLNSVLIIEVTMPAPILINEVHAYAICNLISGYKIGEISCAVHNAGVSQFYNVQSLPLTGFTPHNFTPNVMGDKVRFVLSQEWISQNPTGVAMKKIGINMAYPA